MVNFEPDHEHCPYCGGDWETIGVMEALGCNLCQVFAEGSFYEDDEEPVEDGPVED